jgi:hypothetical protein
MRSISYTFAISLAHAERQEDWGTEGEEGCGEGSASLTPWVVFHPCGACRARYSHWGHLQRLRDEYKP